MRGVISFTSIPLGCKEENLGYDLTQVKDNMVKVRIIKNPQKQKETFPATMQHVRFVDIPHQTNPLNGNCRVAMEVQKIQYYWQWFVNRQTRKGGFISNPIRKIS